MDPVTSLKIIVFPRLEDKIFVGDKKGFCPASSNVFNKPTKSGVLLDDRQTRNGERTESRMLAEERNNPKNRRQFSCPKIIDFNTLKSFQEIRPMHKPRRIFNGFFPSRVRSTTTALGNAYKEGQVSLLRGTQRFISVNYLWYLFRRPLISSGFLKWIVNSNFRDMRNSTDASCCFSDWPKRRFG